MPRPSLNRPAPPASVGQPSLTLRGVGKIYTTPAGSFTALADMTSTIVRASFSR